MSKNDFYKEITLEKFFPSSQKRIWAKFDALSFLFNKCYYFQSILSLLYEKREINIPLGFDKKIIMKIKNSGVCVILKFKSVVMKDEYLDLFCQSIQLF